MIWSLSDICTGSTSRVNETIVEENIYQEINWVVLGLSGK